MRIGMTILLSLLMLMTSFSGCFGSKEEAPTIDDSPFNFDQEIPSTTWYHYAGGVDALNASAVADANITANLTGSNLPFWTNGSYYGVGVSTFEPTMGITSSDNLYMTSWGNGPAGSTAIVQCSSLIEMANLSDYSCVNVYDPILPVPNSNDPYVYVDKWTDRIMKFDMHALLGMTVEWSDNEGTSWSLPTPATSYSVQDHQTISSAPYPAAAHPTTWVFCINGNWEAPLCSTSFDGGNTWSPEVPGAPLGCSSGGLSAHIEGGPNGNFYRGNIGCSGSGYSIYRSTNGGFTWTEHPLPTEESGTADTWNFEEAQVGIDEEGNVHAMWLGADNMPYYAYSRDEGDTWSDAMMIAPPTDLVGTGFPAVTAGGDGRVAFGYLGDSGGDNWNGYLTILTDAFGDTPLFTTVQINDVGDPLDTTTDCGYNRCGGFGDFLDMGVDQYGRPWWSLSHNEGGEVGIFATITNGPSLRGEIEQLNPMPAGGPQTL
ncbi:MAG: hypothetical protein CL969_06585 [Euryarchaeota archaeon]|nr:hypothetical protein [Euryarchaeota archaeon]